MSVFDGIGESINESRTLADQMYHNAAGMQQANHNLKSHLVHVAGLAASPELDRLIKRCDRIAELINMLKAGSFSIEVEREMQATYRRLP